MKDSAVEFSGLDPAGRREWLAEDYRSGMSLELCSVSEHSKGVVSECEYIARLVFSPIHIDRNQKEILPAAFEDVVNKGLSVNRLRYITLDKLNDIGFNKAERDRERKPDRIYEGFCCAVASEIRNLRQEKLGKRYFCVFDTGNESDISHADVWLVLSHVDSGLGKASFRIAARLALKKAFGQLIRPD